MHKINGREYYIAAHRGASGGNIPCNTSVAFEAALLQGADIIELDVSVSKDGQLFVFHPNMEPPHLMSEKYIRDMTADEVAKLRYVNQDNTVTQFGVERFENVMAKLKGRCPVNVDKFWTAPQEIADAIRKLGMQDQVIIKTPVDDAHFAAVEQYAPEMPYMPVLRETDTCIEKIRKMNINCIGAEVCFSTEDAEIASDAYINKMHELGYRLYVNAIVYDYKRVLNAGHSDDIAVSGKMDESWGWLVNKGFDIIQTDWTGMLKGYLDLLCK